MSIAIESTSAHLSVLSPTQGEMFVKESAQADRNRSLAFQPKLLRWIRPSAPGSFVINCDASYRASSGAIGYGFIIRDYFGRLILARAVRFQKAHYVKEEVDYGTVVMPAEMLAIQDGVQYARKLGLMHVEIQSDSKVAISIINGWVGCPLNLFPTYCGIQVEVSFFKGVEFSFVYRECNRPADFLSKFLKDDGRLYFDLRGLPDKLLKLINEDALGFINIRF